MRGVWLDDLHTDFALNTVDSSADQYALGCVAYALLTGSVPFKREVPMAVLYAHLSAPPPRVTDMRPDLDGAVDQVIARAMAKEPDDRYATCGDFAPLPGRILE